MRISLDGSVMQRLVQAAGPVMGAFKEKRVYDLVRIHLMKIGCPRELSATQQNAMNLPLVVEKNRRHFGEIEATGYFPAAVLVAGGARRASQMAQGALLAVGWAERGSLPSKGPDVVSCADLMRKLQAALIDKYYGAMGIAASVQAYPNITEVHPFHNLVSADIGGRRVMHRYVIDPVSCAIGMGDAMPVNELNHYGMPSVDTGVRSRSGLPIDLANNQVSDRGGLNSELMTQVVRNYANINNAVNAYLDAVKHGLYKPMKPSFSPVNLVDGKIAPLALAGIGSADFAAWADGEEVESREFSDQKRKGLAKKGAAMKDGSFPIVNKSDLANAKRAVGRAKNPAAAKAHINKRAKALGEPEIGAGGPGSGRHQGNGKEMHPMVKQAMLHTVTNIGQLSKSDHAALEDGVKKGYLAKGKGGPFPNAKTVYAHPNFDFAKDRAQSIHQMMDIAKSEGRA